MKLSLGEEVSFNDITEKVKSLSLEGSCCMRYCGTQITTDASGKINIIAWQCNMADIQNYDVKLPTVIKMDLGADKTIKNIELMPNFKGSQGLACSRCYLDRRLRTILTGEKLTASNPKISDPYMLCCRHTYELVIGAATLLEANEAMVYAGDAVYTEELIRAYVEENLITCFDHIDCNGRSEKTRITISNYIDNITYGPVGRIENVSGMEVRGYYLDDDEWHQIRKASIVEAPSYDQYVMKMMKIISSYWMTCSRRLCIKRNFYFSQIWGPTFFGIFSQAIGIAIFSNNYTYFQHCIYGIQRDPENKPLCIGVTDNIDEILNVFDDFKMDDLY